MLNQDDLDSDGAEPGDLFGSSIAIGDMDDDGFGEIAVGSPGETLDGDQKAGGVSIIDGSTIEGALSSFWIDQGPILGTSIEPNDEVGSMLRFVDPQADHRQELLIGVPGEAISGKSDAGVVHFVAFDGVSVSQVFSSPRYQGKGFVQRLEPGDRFGAS